MSKQQKQTKKQNGKRQTRIIVCLAVVSTVCAALLAVPIVRHRLDIAALQREVAALPDVVLHGGEAPAPAAADTVNPAMLRLPAGYGPSANEFDAQMRRANPDYIGWLRIAGTNVDYPVVRGSDNIRYLDTTFGGERNIAGAIFADYRNVGDFVPHIIIYGHNAGDADGNSLMFGGLHYFIDEAYMAMRPTITLMTNDSLAEFEIFAARLTDVNDPAYFLDFSAEGAFAAFLERIDAPAGAAQIITLSTCVGTRIDDRRVIVQGALRSIVPIIAATYGEDGWTIRTQE